MITQKSYVTLFTLCPLKETVLRNIDIKQQETCEKFKNKG